MTAVGTLVDRVAAMVERINEGDLDGYMSGYAATVIPHGYAEGVTDYDSLRGFYRQLLDALGGFRVEIVRAVGQEDVVAVQFVLHGQHTGELMGAAPSGRNLVVEGATFLRFQDQLVAERWQYADGVGLMQQLGLLPS